MNKKLITMLVTFCFMLLLAPVSVMAATPTNAPIVIDVYAYNTPHEEHSCANRPGMVRKDSCNAQSRPPSFNVWLDPPAGCVQNNTQNTRTENLCN